MWATSVPILVFLGLSVLDLGPMYATDTSDAHHRLMPPTGRGHKDLIFLHCAIGAVINQSFIGYLVAVRLD